jgi:hypothetical protein
MAIHIVPALPGIGNEKSPSLMPSFWLWAREISSLSHRFMLLTDAGAVLTEPDISWIVAKRERTRRNVSFFGSP